MRHLHDLLATELDDFARSLRWRLKHEGCVVDVAATGPDLMLRASSGYAVIFVRPRDP